MKAAALRWTTVADPLLTLRNRPSSQNPVTTPRSQNTERKGGEIEKARQKSSDGAVRCHKALARCHCAGKKASMGGRNAEFGGRELGHHHLEKDRRLDERNCGGGWSKAQKGRKETGQTFSRDDNRSKLTVKKIQM
jgi:hypothetical protein